MKDKIYCRQKAVIQPLTASYRRNVVFINTAGLLQLRQLITKRSFRRYNTYFVIKRRLKKILFLSANTDGIYV